MNKQKLTVDLFQRAGYDVLVTHERRYKVAFVNGDTGKIVTKVELHPKTALAIVEGNTVHGYYVQLLPNGGKTTVSVIDTKTGDEFEGVAYCRNDENYNKKTGVNVALDQIVNLMVLEPGYTPLMFVE